MCYLQREVTISGILMSFPNSIAMPANSIDTLLLQLAVDLSAQLPEGEHYQRLLDSLNQVLPSDASALFILDAHKSLVPVAISGLSPAILGRRFEPSAHPRLAAILASREPVRFEAGSPLPDPFDGLVEGMPDGELDVHDCLGCSLYVEDELVGAITLDAMEVGAFSRVSEVTISTIAALAAANVRNVTLIEALRSSNRHQHSINQLLIEQARAQQGELVGNSPQMQQLQRSIATVAPSDFAVLISGETGTGKELVAHLLHAQSTRSDKPMIQVNCAALPESLAESELFGHVKGAFTGATSHRPGKFELADEGTLFLDEIGELPLLLQAKLLRVLQQGEVQRVGADKLKHVNVRIIAATNRDLQHEVEQGRFRADLYHRLHVFPIQLPPLRERDGDIPLLAGHLLDKVRTQFHAPQLHIQPRCLSLLEQQGWPGNVRELEHCLMRAALSAIQQGEQVITQRHLGLQQVNPSLSASIARVPEQGFRRAIEDYQKRLIEQALAQHDGVWAQAARSLQMDRGNLYRLGKKLGVV